MTSNPYKTELSHNAKLKNR